MFTFCLSSSAQSNIRFLSPNSKISVWSIATATFAFWQLQLHNTTPALEVFETWTQHVNLMVGYAFFIALLHHQIETYLFRCSNIVSKVGGRFCYWNWCNWLHKNGIVSIAWIPGISIGVLVSPTKILVSYFM